MKIQVKGHSGCNIEIVNNGDSLYISKSTNNPKYVARLHQQALKQINAAKNSYQHIRVPEIYAVERDENHVEIRMEYVYGKNYIDYFEDAGFENISYFIKVLKVFVDKEIEQSEMQEVPVDIIRNKFNSVYNNCMANAFLKDDEEVRIILRLSEELIESIDTAMYMPVGECHGDLTFSNIIFNGNNYYLIDFLDSFIESPLLDLVKIRQDSCYGWSKLMYDGTTDDVRMDIISKKIDEEIDVYYRQYEWYSNYYLAFQLLNFLRVMQYTKNGGG